MPESQSPTQPGPGPNLDIDASVEISTRRGEDRIDVIWLLSDFLSLIRSRDAV